MSPMAMKGYSAEFKADAVALYLSDLSHTFEGIGKSNTSIPTRIP